MKNKYVCIVDANSNYLDVVDAEEKQIDGEAVISLSNYELKDGEQIVDSPPPAIKLHSGASGFIKAQWQASKWVEAATAEEISVWETDNPAPPDLAPPPTPEQLAIAQLMRDVAVIKAKEAATNV